MTNLSKQDVEKVKNRIKELKQFLKENSESIGQENREERENRRRSERGRLEMIERNMSMAPFKDVSITPKPGRDNPYRNIKNDRDKENCFQGVLDLVLGKNKNQNKNRNKKREKNKKPFEELLRL